MTSCYCDFDPAQVYRQSIHVARKQYWCEECAGKILPGERYEYTFGVWDGDASTFRTCERCHDIRQWVQNNVPCFCWTHGRLDEDAQVAVEDAVYRAPEETAGLRFGLLRRKLERQKFNAARRAA